jgi:CheY-specific phosphatase CheX
MARKFFGQFLIEIGEVQPKHVREAVTLMDDTNPVIGEFAVSANVLSERDANRINREQRRTDRKFGDLAVGLGLLTTDQVRDLVREQKAQRLSIGQALCQLGHLESDHLDGLLKQFGLDQAGQVANRYLKLPEELDDSLLVDCVLDLFPKLTQRIARIQLFAQSCEKWSGQELQSQVATVSVRGDESWDITLSCDKEFASQIHAGFMGGFTHPKDQDDTEEISSTLLDDCIGEFLNILAGTAMDELEKQAITVCLEPPFFGQSPTEGYHFDIQASRGNAALILSPA